MVAKDFEGCVGWAPSKLMQEFVCQPVSFISPDYGFAMKAGPKANNKKVILEMLKFATVDERKSLTRVIGGT